MYNEVDTNQMNEQAMLKRIALLEASVRELNIKLEYQERIIELKDEVIRTKEDFIESLQDQIL